MDVVIFLAVLAALTAYVAAPLYAPVPARRRVEDRSRLEARREVLVAALRELELDRGAGGVSEDDYAHERARLEAEAAAVLRALEHGPGD